MLFNMSYVEKDALSLFSLFSVGGKLITSKKTHRGEEIVEVLEANFKQYTEVYPFFKLLLDNFSSVIFCFFKLNLLQSSFVNRNNIF